MTHELLGVTLQSTGHEGILHDLREATSELLARLRIGHTRITHSYLLKREEPPYCFGCDTLFTVRHFLLECGDFSHIRNKYFHVDTIKQLFNDVPIDNVFLFLKEINLFNKL